MSAPSRPWWTRGAGSLAWVLALHVVWILVSLAAPTTMAWLNPDPIGHPEVEGPLEAFENVLLPVCIVLWVAIAWRHRGDRARVVLALLMVLQMAFVLGEEVDWGQTIGLRGFGGWRNVRMLLRDHGLLQRWNDALVPTAYYLFFMIVPLVPLAPVRRWLDRVAPVRAEVGDALAVIVLPPAWMTISHLVVPQKSVELIQLSAYTVATNVAIRILRARHTPT